MSRPDVTICIPTWQAEPFIDRTLTCARAQTYANIRILVSIDRCEDGTEAKCWHHAKQDSRIEVLVQNQRLGFAENTNLLLDRVDTQFCFLYFHDDIIEPTYTECLLAALQDHPEAKSAHCDMGRFGLQQGIVGGTDYEGNATERLARLLVGPVTGTPLRSLFRSELIEKGLRFSIIGEEGFWRCRPFLMHLLAAGPARHVPEVLYRRWFRDGSMTTTWKPTREAFLEGQSQSAKICLEIIRSLDLPQ